MLSGRSSPPGGCAQVVEHQHEEEHREQQRERRAGDLLRSLAHELVDLVADHVRLRRGRDEVGGVVVAEHRQRDQHRAGEDPRDGERKRDAQERAQRARPEVARGLDLAPVDPVDGDEQRQDEERQVAVDEREDDRRRLPVEPAAGLVEQAGW
jgi:hypothetical protein